MKIAGHSREDPPRWWLRIPGLGEIRLYRYGVELLIGPTRCFLALEAGTLGIRSMLVRE